MLLHKPLAKNHERIPSKTPLAQNYPGRFTDGPRQEGSDRGNALPRGAGVTGGMNVKQTVTQDRRFSATIFGLFAIRNGRVVGSRRPTSQRDLEVQGGLSSRTRRPLQAVTKWAVGQSAAGHSKTEERRQERGEPTRHRSPFVVEQCCHSDLPARLAPWR